MNCLSDMRYEHYTSNAAVQRAKSVFSEVNRMQKDAIVKVLQNEVGNGNFDKEMLEHLLSPVFDVTRDLVSRRRETAVREAGMAFSVRAVARSLGRLTTTTKVSSKLILRRCT